MEVNGMSAPARLMLALTPMVVLGRPLAAWAQRPLMYVTRQCNENAIHLRLDPRPFQDVIGPGFSLALAEGKAQVTIIVHDCSQIWIDGQDLGPAQELRVWVAIRGRDDVRPVVGAERTQPTQTWFALFEGSSNPRIREAKAAAGTAESPVDSLFLAPPEPEGVGRVYLGGTLALRWRVPLPAAPPVRLVGLNHDVYARDAARSVVLNRIQALMHLSGDASSGTLEVVAGGGAVPFISPGTYAVSVRMFFPMWSRATLGLPPRN